MLLMLFCSLDAWHALEEGNAAISILIARSHPCRKSAPGSGEIYQNKDVVQAINKTNDVVLVWKTQPTGEKRRLARKFLVSSPRETAKQWANTAMGSEAFNLLSNLCFFIDDGMEAEKAEKTKRKFYVRKYNRLIKLFIDSAPIS